MLSRLRPLEPPNPPSFSAVNTLNGCVYEKTPAFICCVVRACLFHVVVLRNTVYCRKSAKLLSACGLYRLVVPILIIGFFFRVVCTTQTGEDKMVNALHKEHILTLTRLYISFFSDVISHDDMFTVSHMDKFCNMYSDMTLKYFLKFLSRFCNSDNFQTERVCTNCPVLSRDRSELVCVYVSEAVKRVLCLNRAQRAGKISVKRRNPCSSLRCRQQCAKRAKRALV